MFIGQDIIAQDGSSKKQAALEKIKGLVLPKAIADFNLDTLYSKELNLKGLQEKLLVMPLKTKKRIVVIKDAASLKDDIREFMLEYVKKPSDGIILVLDLDSPEPRDSFFGRLYNYAKVYYFSQPAHLDTFSLCRLIDKKETAQALKVLNQLLQEGEKPEWILGGLRFAWERNPADNLEIRKRLKLLLNCDIEIKTSKLKPLFALEKLIITLCGFGKFSG